MTSRIPAIGVATTPGSNGSLPLRREIRDLQANYKDQFNLYILALVDLQKKPVTDLLSYYQIAGIHGEPYVPWNQIAGDENATFGGYCTHSSILFLTWHRPYLALYEQALYASVQTIAGRYAEPLQARYLAAAKDFRMPYWDWAARITMASAFPTAVSSSSITVIDVDGTSKQISNPLYSFRFDDKKIPPELALDKFWSRDADTKRVPDVAGRSQNAVVAQVIGNEAASLRNNVSLLLLSYKQFDAVSNNAWARGGNVGQYGSLEDVHNEIHDKVGGQNGHMGSLEVSSFDPVFWLHHTNVDRLWAIWQALNPNAFSIDKTAQAREANFTIAAGTHITASTELKPFFDASGTRFWNSTGVKYTTPFGHAYPETQPWLYPSDQAYQTAVRNDVVRQYGANVINNFFTNIASVGKSSDGSPLPAASPARAKVAESSVETGSPQGNNSIKTTISHPFQSVKKALHEESATASLTANASVALDRNIATTNDDSTSNNEHAHNPGAAATPLPVPAPAPIVPQSQEQIRFQQNSHTEAPSRTPTSAPLNVPKEFEHLFPNRTYTEWITNIRAQKHGLSQTFRVYIFLGDFPSDPFAWPTTYNVVGRFTVLGRGPAPGTSCSKCQRDAADELVVTGTVPLTSALLQDIVAGQVDSLNSGSVEGYLERNLHWRVTGFDGNEIDRNEVPGLKVSIVSTKVRIGDDGIPIYTGDYETHESITDGRPAGLGSGDEV